PELPLRAAENAPAPAEPVARYPFDPVCPWGRLADGHGVLVRCLEAREAQNLTAASAHASPAASTPAPSVAVSPKPAGSVPALSASAPNPAAHAVAAAPQPHARHVSVKEVGPAQADTGELPEAQHQLAKVRDRYVQCVDTNGGMDGGTGQVTLRFLVRERGRAEGVAVKDRRGVSLAAAKCVAEVVDRRYVGYPAAPIVGATMTIEFAPESAGR
ncbi:MAG TPA: hypothetical protein VG963_00360, partial [Polyangiaceae bacterium]|nr:hypothetical protein [Polyangiaceae bacterium]